MNKIREMTGEDETGGQRPTWAEIDLDALASNFRLVRDRVGASALLKLMSNSQSR